MQKRNAGLLRIVLVAIVGAASFNASASERLIDAFIAGAQTLLPGDVLPVVDTRGGLEPTSVIGGERQVTFRVAGDPTNASVDIDTTAGELTLITGSDFGYLDLKYGAFSSLNADLLADGGSQIEIKFTSLSLDLYRGFYELELVDNNAVSETVILDQQMYDLPGGGTIVIPFSAYQNVDFSIINQIHLNMGRIEPGLTMVIDYLKITPEPTSVLLLGLASLFLRRR